MKYMRDDASYVLVVDVAHARQAPLFHKVEDLVRDRYAWWDDKLIDTIVIGGDANKHTFVAVVEGKADKLIALARGDAKTADVYGGVKIWHGVVDAAVVDRRLVVASPGGVQNAIDRARAKTKKPLAVQTILTSAPSGVDAFGGLALQQAERGEFRGPLGADVEWVGISVASAAKLQIDVRIAVTEESDAKAAAPKLQLLIDQSRDTLISAVGREFSDSISVDADGSIVRLSATMTDEELDRVVTWLKMLM